MGSFCMGFQVGSRSGVGRAKVIEGQWTNSYPSFPMNLGQCNVVTDVLVLTITHRMPKTTFWQRLDTTFYVTKKFEFTLSH